MGRLDLERENRIADLIFKSESLIKRKTRMEEQIFGLIAAQDPNEPQQVDGKAPAIAQNIQRELLWQLNANDYIQEIKLTFIFPEYNFLYFCIGWRHVLVLFQLPTKLLLPHFKFFGQ